MRSGILKQSLILLAGVAVVLALMTWQQTASAAEVQISITVKANEVARDPITTEVKVGDTIKWTSQPDNAGDAAKIRITLAAVVGNPFAGGASYDSGIVAIGAAIPASLAVRAGAATATPNTYRYEIRVFKADNTEIVSRRQTQNWIWVPDTPGTADPKVRGLFLSGPGSAAFDSDVDHLEDVIDGFGTDWSGTTVKDDRTAPNVVADIAAAFAGADDDDVSVLLYSGHGGKVRDANGDEPANDTIRLQGRPAPAPVICRTLQCDETLNSRDPFVDDSFAESAASPAPTNLAKALENIRGIKVIVIDACFSGGMDDGTLDLPIPNSIIIQASGTNEQSYASNRLVFGHPHSFFAGSLATGLLDAGTGYAKADVDPPGVVPIPDRIITVEEWYNFASPLPQAKIVSSLAAGELTLTRLKTKLGVDPTQTPEINDSFAPEGRKKGDVVIFTYAKGALSPHVHADPPSPLEDNSACSTIGDCGDADPQYPVKPADDGACHLDTENEWFGRPLESHDDSVSNEADAVDPDDPDGVPNLREDISGWDLDRFDDGVLFFPLTYKPGARGKVEFNVCVEALGVRYDPADPDKTLYVNAWIDWDTDFDWQEANDEHIIDGLKLAPVDISSWGPLAGSPSGSTTVTQIGTAADGKCGIYKAEFDVGPDIGTGELWARFRLDYGENVGRNDPQPLFDTSSGCCGPTDLDLTRGLAQFGEVEDYLLGTDFGDAPDPPYPTRKSSAGARHLDFNREWLGPPGIYASATREIDGCDTTLAEEDRIPNLGSGCTSDDEDRKDDGAVVPTLVIPGQTVNIEIDVSAKVDSFGYANRGPGGEDSVGVLTLQPNCGLAAIPNEPDTPVFHRDRGRYAAWDPERRLYLNVWADWNANGIWEGGELVISGPLDPEDWGKDGNYTLGEPFDDVNGNEVRTSDESFTDVAGIPTRHLTCPVTVPLDVATDKEFWWRFRVDYGENVTTNDNVVHHATEDGRALAGPLGGALWGEVEDYPMSTIEIDFFPNSFATVTLETPFGPDTVQLTGPTTIEVNFGTLGDVSDECPSPGGPDAPNGLEEVQTEMVQLELKGVSAIVGPVTVRLRDPSKHPNQQSTGQIEENINHNPFTLDLPPFIPEADPPDSACSFFDVFFEIEIPLLEPFPLILHSHAPKRMEAEIFYKPPKKEYKDNTPIPLFDEAENATGIEITTTIHSPGGPPPKDWPSVSTGEVGGTIELIVGGSDAQASDGDGFGGSFPYAVAVAAAGALALAAGGWYARRRWLR